MISVTMDIELACVIDGDEDLTFIRTDLLNSGEHLTTLEYSDITSYYKELLDISDKLSLFESEDQLKASIINAQLLKFLNEERDDSKFDLLLNIKMKARHQAGTCEGNCILCNPDLGDDPFPDFTFDVKFFDPEGEA